MRSMWFTPSWKVPLKQFQMINKYYQLPWLTPILGGSEGKESAWNAGDVGLIPVSGRAPGEWNGNPFQYSCLENTMHGGAWWAIVHPVAESNTTDWLHFHFHHG